MTVLGTVCQYHAYAFTDQAAPDSPSVFNSFKNGFPLREKGKACTLVQRHSLACTQLLEQLASACPFRHSCILNGLYTGECRRSPLEIYLHREETKDRDSVVTEGGEGPCPPCAFTDS